MWALSEALYRLPVANPPFDSKEELLIRLVPEAALVEKTGSDVIRRISERHIHRMIFDFFIELASLGFMLSLYDKERKM